MNDCDIGKPVHEDFPDFTFEGRALRALDTIPNKEYDALLELLVNQGMIVRAPDGVPFISPLGELYIRANGE